VITVGCGGAGSVTSGRGQPNAVVAEAWTRSRLTAYSFDDLAMSGLHPANVSRASLGPTWHTRYDASTLQHMQLMSMAVG
jgi:hypothetical protein